MNIEKAREYVTHKLAGELTPQEASELDAFVAEHPEFAEEMRRMQDAWERLGALKADGVAIPEMSGTLRERLRERTRLRKVVQRSFPLGWIAAAAMLMLGLFVALQVLNPRSNNVTAQGAQSANSVPRMAINTVSDSAVDLDSHNGTGRDMMLRSSGPQYYNGSFFGTHSITEIVISPGCTLTTAKPMIAEAFARRAVLVDPASLQARLDLVLALQRAGKCAGALREMDVLLKAAPDSVYLWLERADLLHKLGQSDQTYAAAKKAMALARAGKAGQETYVVICIQELSDLGKYEEAARELEALALASPDESKSLSLFRQACSAYSSAKMKDKCNEVWDKAIAKWPSSGKTLSAAATSLAPFDPGRALIFADKAEAIGADVFEARATALFTLKRDAEAWKLLGDRVARAADADATVAALRGVARDPQRASWMAQDLLAKEKGPRMIGAIRYLVSSDLSDAALTALLAATARPDFPDDQRMALVGIIRRCDYEDTRWTDVLRPLFNNAEKKEARPALFQALEFIASINFDKRSAPFVTRLASVGDLDVDERLHVELLQWRVSLGEANQAVLAPGLEKAFRECHDPSLAARAASILIQRFMARSEFDRAAEIGADWVNRFGDDPTVMGYRRAIVGQLRSPDSDAAVKKFEALVKSPEPPEPKDSIKELKDQYSQAAKLIAGKQYAQADDILCPLWAQLESARKSLSDQLVALDKRIAESQKKTGPTDAQLTKEQGRAYLTLLADKERIETQRQEVASIFHLVTAMRPQIAARDVKLRAVFLAECAEKAKTEDRIYRDWTSAALACLSIAGGRQSKEYGQMLERLRGAEPDDPVWPQMLADAYMAQGELEKARLLLKQFLAVDPEDVHSALALWTVAQRSTDEEKKAEAANRLIDMAKRDHTLLDSFTRQWQADKQYDLAVRAYLAAADAQPAEQRNTYLQQAANLLEQAGQKTRSAEICFQILHAPTLRTSDGCNAVDRLASLMSDPEAAQFVRENAPGLLLAKEEPDRACGLLLQYALAKTDSNEPQTRQALDALIANSMQNRGNLSYRIVNDLVEAKRYVDAAQYAQSVAADMDQYNRSQLLRQCAERLAQNKESCDLAAGLYRQLVEQASVYDVKNLRSALVSCLAGAGRLDEARQELAKLPLSQYSSERHNARAAIIGAYYRANDLPGRLRFVLEEWGRTRDSSSFSADPAFQELLRAYRDALAAKSVPEDLRKAAADCITDECRRYYEGKSSTNPTSFQDGIDALPQLIQVVEEASKSGNPEGMLRAAQSYKDGRWDITSSVENATRALDICRAVVAIKDASPSVKSQAYSMIFELRRGHGVGTWTEALAAVEQGKVTGSSPNFLEYAMSKATCLYSLDRRDEAREAVREMLKTGEYRRDESACLALGDFCRKGEDIDYIMKAECYEQAIRIMISEESRYNTSQIAEYYATLGVCYLDTGAPEKAGDMFVRSLATADRKQSDGHRRYRQVCDLLTNAIAKGSPNGLDSAVAYYETNMREKGEMPQMRLAFAYGYRDAGQEEKALAQFEIAADLVPEDTTLRDEIAKGYLGLKMYYKAERAYLHWAKSDPQNVELYKGLGQLYETMNRPEDAMLAYASMAQARPREAEGHRAYAQVLAAKGMKTEAAVEYEKACKYRPTEFAIASELAAIYDALGQAEKKAGLWKDGEAACRQAMTDVPDDPLAWLNLARFLKAQGRTAEARDLCQQILNRHWPRFASETRTTANDILRTL